MTWAVAFFLINLAFAVILFFQDSTILTVIGVLLILEGLVHIGYTYWEIRREERNSRRENDC